MHEWLSRSEALAQLNVRPQTLYAYVSRGQIERQADPVDPRRSLYRSTDILAMSQRRARGRRTASIAASAMAWGEPVIPTTISTVDHGELIYRGRRAVEFAESSTLEEVATLLWDTRASVSFPEVPCRGDPFSSIGSLVAHSRSLIGRPATKVASEAATCVATIAAAFGATGDALMHDRLGLAWSLDDGGRDLIRRALVLLADHELNPSTFSARIAASTGASIPACILAGLATLSGPRHGGAGAALAALVAESANTGTETSIERWLAAGNGLPGFGHPLYPHGDPRAIALLDRIEPDAEMSALRDTVAELLDVRPNVDFALLTIGRGLGLPTNAQLSLFAIARSVGWSAHAIEQAASRSAIRPRAIYERPD